MATDNRPHVQKWVFFDQENKIKQVECFDNGNGVFYVPYHGSTTFAFDTREQCVENAKPRLRQFIFQYEAILDQKRQLLNSL